MKITLDAYEIKNLWAEDLKKKVCRRTFIAFGIW